MGYMKYYKFRYTSKFSKAMSGLLTVISALLLPPFLVFFVYYLINVIFKSLEFPDETIAYLFFGAFIFSIFYIIRYFVTLKGVFLYDDTLEIEDASITKKEYRIFDVSRIVSIEWVGLYRKAPHASYSVGFTQQHRLFLILRYLITRRPLSNHFGSSGKDCVEIAFKSEKNENEREYIYLSIENTVDFMRDIKEKMLEHGNYKFEDEQ